MIWLIWWYLPAGGVASGRVCPATCVAGLFSYLHWCVLVHLVQRFFMGKFNNKFSKSQANLKMAKKEKMVLFLSFQKKIIKCMHHLPGMHRKCCETCWSTFLILLFERACCSYMPGHFTIRQCVQLFRQRHLQK